MPKPDDKTIVIHKVGFAFFKDGKILMAREHKNKEVFYTVGGRLEGQETDEECLHREVKEELDTDIKAGSLKFLGEFEAPAYGRQNTLLKMKLYSGELVGQPEPASEIAELAYFDTSVDQRHLSPIDKKILPWLQQRDYIK